MSVDAAMTGEKGEPEQNDGDEQGGNQQQDEQTPDSPVGRNERGLSWKAGGEASGMRGGLPARQPAVHVPDVSDPRQMPVPSCTSPGR
jgi:hypothetical protein